MKVSVSEIEHGAPFRLVARAGDRIESHWRIVPDLNMEKAFDAFLQMAASGKSGLVQQEKEALGRLGSSPRIDVFAARWCESSSSAVEAASRVVVQRPSIQMRVLDVESFAPDLLPAGMSSVPLVLVGDRGRLYGACTTGELISALEACDEGHSERQTLLNMLEQRLRDEIHILLKHRLLSARSVAALVGEERMGIRMGAILLLSELVRTDRAAAEGALDPLLGLLMAPQAHIRADAVYALGELCDLRALPYLNKLMCDTNEDVREGVQEAREKIKAFNVLRR